MSNKQVLLLAVEAALNGEWEQSHNIAQEYSDVTANWIHAVLHKIEGDESNSKYWYARSSNNEIQAKHYEDFNDANTELKTIQKTLNQG
ncbi:MAG: hypothetical protein WBP13_12605 [Methylophilaceae bacterium]